MDSNKTDRIRVQRLRSLNEQAPEMNPVEETDGIKWTLLSKPYPEACSYWVDKLRQEER